MLDEDKEKNFSSNYQVNK